MSVLKKVVLAVFMIAGFIIFIDYLVFAIRTEGSFANYFELNKAYVAHFPSFIRPLVDSEGVLFRFAGGFMLIIPGVVLLVHHQKEQKQTILVTGILSVCIGGLMLWMNL